MSQSFFGLLLLVTVGGVSIGGLAAALTSPTPPPGLPTLAALRGGAAQPAGRPGASPAVAQAPVVESQRTTATGTIERVAEQAITLKTESGPVQVTLTDRTTYQKQAAASLSDLKIGEMVTARTDETGDTSTVVRSLQVMPAGSGQPGQLAGGTGARPQFGGTGARPQSAGGGERGQATPGAGSRSGAMTERSMLGQRAGVFGTIQSIEGKDLTITTGSGPVKLTVADGAQIRRIVAASRGDLQVGQTVSIVGQRGPNDAVAALAVTIEQS